MTPYWPQNTPVWVCTDHKAYLYELVLTTNHTCMSLYWPRNTPVWLHTDHKTPYKCVLTTMHTCMSLYWPQSTPGRVCTDSEIYLNEWVLISWSIHQTQTTWTVSDPQLAAEPRQWHRSASQLHPHIHAYIQRLTLLEVFNIGTVRFNVPLYTL